MIQVALLTVTQKALLTEQLFSADEYFNPCQDVNGNWYISIESANNCIVESFVWVKTLPLIDYAPIVFVK